MVMSLVFLVGAVLPGIVLQKFKNKYAKWIYLLFAFVLLWLFLGLRALHIGADTLSYYNIYKSVDSQGLVELLKHDRTEPLYLIWCKIFTTLNLPYQVFLIITSFVILSGPFFLISKYSTNFWLSVLIYISLRFYPFNFNLIRQSMAISLFCFALYFFFKHKAVAYYVLIVLACFIHFSAVVLLVLYPLRYLLQENVSIKIILFTSILLGVLFFISAEKIFTLVTTLLDGRYSTYLKYFTFSEVNLLLMAICTWAGFMTLFAQNKNECRKKRLHQKIGSDIVLAFDKSAFICLCLGVIVFGFGVSFSLAERIGSFFLVPAIFYFTRIIKPEDGKSTARKKTFLITLAILAIFIIFGLSKHGLANVFPYDFGWTV